MNRIEAPFWISIFEGFLVGRVALVDLDLAALVADRLENLLDFSDKTCVKLASVSTSRTEYSHTNMKNRNRQLDVTKMTRTFLHALIAGSALESTIDGAKTGITKARGARFLLCFIL